MPEGPELYKAAVLVNKVCKYQVFTGNIVKSAVSTKNPEVEHDFQEYTVRAESRGKEMALVLSAYPQNDRKTEQQKDIRILFRFGMSGRFQFGPIGEMHKHAHLNFFAKLKSEGDGKNALVLSFVDTRRFGGWQVKDTWSEERGPDPIFEYEAFRSNVLNNLKASPFNKPLCEVLHNQKYFNGIGNYLRAEIIFRSGLPPFTCARSVFENLQPKPMKDKKSNAPDILELCHIVPSEVIKLGVGFDASGAYSDYSEFQVWLRCYYNTELNNLVDHDGRTIWFKGKPGPMAPKVSKSRNAKSGRKRRAGPKVANVKKEGVKVEETGSPTKKARTASKKNVSDKAKLTNSKRYQKSQVKATRSKSQRNVPATKMAPKRQSLRIRKNKGSKDLTLKGHPDSQDMKTMTNK